MRDALTGAVEAFGITFIDVLEQDKLVCKLENVDSRHSMRYMLVYVLSSSTKHTHKHFREIL